MGLKVLAQACDGVVLRQLVSRLQDAGDATWESAAATLEGTCRAILGRFRATWKARTGAALSGSGRERRSPKNISRSDPYMTGLKWAVKESPKISAVTCASVVQPAWESRQA
jgi:hypothetical protein